jgi:alkenylglycerophosphocholine/alkenylglycerophosphoethanolamine hydrolase
VTRSEKSAFSTALALGVLYIALIPQQPYPLSWLLKPLPVLIYAWLCWRAFPGAEGKVLGLGYIAAAIGDFFLDYGNRDGMFRQALLAFLVNQIAFATGFAWLSRGKRMYWLRTLPVIAYCMFLAFWLLPKSGDLLLPVSIYLVALLSMGVLACRVETKIGLLWLGAMLFVLADSLIGINKFAMPFNHSVLIIVTLYLSGQSLIAWALMREARRRDCSNQHAHIGNAQCDNSAST